MVMNRSIATVLAMVLSAAPAWAQLQLPQQTPPGPSPARAAVPPSFAAAAARFWEIGNEIAHAENITGPEADQAIILLTAAKSLNRQLVGAEPLLLKLAGHQASEDYSNDLVVFWLQEYVSSSADRAIVAEAIRGVLSRVNSPDQRKTLLEKLALKIKNKNPAIDSDVATLLGQLVLEQGDTEQAKWYLVQAYNNNRYNRTAFAELGKVAPDEIGPAANLEHLRLLVRENPLDLDAAMAFAGYAGQLQLYDVSAQAYSYCAELFRYLYPSEPLPQKIYLPLALSCYNVNTQEAQKLCLTIADIIRTENRFDIILEAFAGRAAIKLGQPLKARQMFQRAERKAEELMAAEPGLSPTPGPAGGEPVRPPNARQLAWFYSFADPNTAKALDWANKAYAAEPNSLSARALLAYALSLNNRLDLTKDLFASSEEGQLADLVRARVQLAGGNRPDAIQTLKTAITRDPGSLAAERAKDLLRELGGAYSPPVDPAPLASFLTTRFGKALVPPFLPPDKMIDIQFSVRGADFSYGRELDGVVTLVNKSTEPLVITENSLFQGNIRISARVAGDVKQEIPNLISEPIRTSLIVDPGKNLTHTFRLSTGELRDILLTYAQAALQVQFTLYLDPVATDKGTISNRLVDVKPVTASITRPRVEVTSDFAQSRINIITAGQESQKAQTALLFTGLLKEQSAMAERGNLYVWQYADWLTNQLRTSLMSPSGLLLGGGDSEWAVKVNTMADMVSLPLDQDLAAVVLKNLNHSQWPVRLMAVYVLGKGVPNSVGNVLDWVIKNDKDVLVRRMATSLQASLAMPPQR